jgi:hypothetical protein
MEWMNDDDLWPAYYVIQRFLQTIGPDVKTLPADAVDWCLKVAVAFEMSDCGHESGCDEPELDEELCNTAEAARIIGITERHARRLGTDLAGRKCGSIWLFSKASVTRYAERWSR